MDQNRFDKLGIVDYLNEMNQPSDFSNRKKLYQSLFQNIPVNYTGSTEQNTELANALRDTYKSVGSNLGVRPDNDPLLMFSRKLLSRSIFEGNRPSVRQPTYMSGIDNLTSSSSIANLFGAKPNQQDLITKR